MQRSERRAVWSAALTLTIIVGTLACWVAHNAAPSSRAGYSGVSSGPSLFATMFGLRDQCLHAHAFDFSLDVPFQ